jgi:hypothetical protein
MRFKWDLVGNEKTRPHLSRADLIQAMNPADVKRSETHYVLGGHRAAEFHFVRVPVKR